MTGPGSGPLPVLDGSSYLSRSPWAADIWADLQRCIPAPLLPELAECVFVMIKPDALAAHEHGRFLKMLNAAGIQLLQVWPCLRAGLREYEELYKFNLTLQNTQNMLSHWWLTSRQFTLGQSIALLVRVPAQVRGDRSAYQYFGDLKGPSNPYLAQPGQLRYELRSTNLALNMVHCADDPLSSAREALIFGTGAQLIAGLRRSAELGSGDDYASWEDEASERFELSVRAVRAPKTDIRFVPVLTTVKLRIRSLAADDVKEATACLYRDYLIHGDGCDLPAHEAWRRFEALSRKERSVLDSLRPADRAGRLLAELTRVAAHDLDFSRRLATETFGLGLPLTAWEELVLDTSLFYRNHLADGRPVCAE